MRSFEHSASLYRCNILSDVNAFVLLAILFVSIGSPAFAQSGDYIVVSDTVYMQGRVYHESDSSVIFYPTRKSPFKRFTSDSVSQFGINSEVFESVRIGHKRKFAKLLAKGKISLYAFQKIFILIKSDSTILLYERDGAFKDSLKSLVTDCEELKKATGKINYSDFSLTSFIKLYNEGKCDLKRIPRIRYGLSLGYFYGTLDFVNKSTTEEYNSDFKTFTPCFSVERPLYFNGKLVLNADFLLYGFRATGYTEESISTSMLRYTNFEYKMNALVVPLSLKFFPFNSRLQPYIKGGLAIGYNFNKRILLLQSEHESSSGYIDVEQIEIPEYNSISYGFNFSFGIDYFANQDYNLFLELNYISLNKDYLSNTDTKISGPSISIGLSF